MAIKFRKRVRLFPGFYLNLSKSGMSAKVGMRGLSFNLGNKGTYLNTGLPGTGLYDRVRIGNKNNNSSHENYHPSNQPNIPDGQDDTIDIKSYQPELITSDGLYGLKESIINAQKVKEELKIESNKISIQYYISLFILVISYCLIFGLFIKWFKNNYNTKLTASKEAKDNYSNFKLDIDFNMDKSILNDYLLLKKCFEQITTIDTIWDITSARSVNQVKERSAASKTMSRVKVKFSLSSLDYINTKYDALRFQNANGGDIFIYPGFWVMIDKRNKEFALIDYREITIEHHNQQFIETDRIPRDTQIVGRTWKYVNKNGSPDKRFKDNQEIPIALYYELNLETEKGLYESYQFSNPELGQDFCASLSNYQYSLKNMIWSKEEVKEIESNSHNQ